jgi:hypothetical protein
MIDPQQIFRRSEDWHWAYLSDVGTAGRRAAFWAEREKPDLTRDLRGQ